MIIIFVGMADKKLRWKKLSEQKLLETKVATIYTQKEMQDNGQVGDYIGIGAPDWVLIIAIHNDKFVLVKQFRHAYQDITIEFPGGVIENNENPLFTAKRELKEETGYEAKSWSLLASLSPNPAIMKNTVHFYLAEELTSKGPLHLDEDEYLNVIEEPINEVIAKFGSKPYVHSFLGTGVMLYLRKKGKGNK